MSNEQKLREAFELGWKLAAQWSLSDHLLADMESPTYLTERDGLLQALATTEPEPTGMPSRPPLPRCMYTNMQYQRMYIGNVYTADQMRAYGEQCWKVGYKHGAWGDNKQTSKQSLQVEPAVNQQLTTDPVVEREAFEREMSKPPFEFCMDRWPDDGAYAWPGNYAAYHTQCAWDAWQARAAMAQVGDINVVESFTNDTKDALMAGRAYAQEALIRFDDAYDRHPSTEPERNAILTDIQLIDAAMAKGVKG